MSRWHAFRFARWFATSLSPIPLCPKIQSNSTTHYSVKLLNMMLHSTIRFGSVDMFCRAVKTTMLLRNICRLLQPSSCIASWAAASSLIISVCVIVVRRLRRYRFPCLYSPCTTPLSFLWPISVPGLPPINNLTLSVLLSFRLGKKIL